MDKKSGPATIAGTKAEINPVESSIAQLEAFERPYVQRFNLALFPVKERDKVPMTQNGFKDATRDWQDYQKLHGGRPHNVGMPTGPINGLFVLDLDPRHGGDETFKHLLSQYDTLPPTWQTTTQSGGTHFFFKWDDNRLVGNRANVLPGLDIRGDGGYVLLPPSRVEGDYRWVRSPSKFELLPAPDWLWTVLETSAHASAAVDIGKFANGILDGQRNDSFTKIIGTLLGRGVDMKLAWSLVESYNQVKCYPPLEETELLKTFKSVAQREINKRQRRQRKWGA